MTTTADKINMLASYKAAQYAAIVAKGASVIAADWGAYAAAIRTIPSGTIAVPKIVTDMPFTVDAEPTGTAWYVRPDGAGDKDGTSWSNAFATRQEAVNAASAGDHIRVWEGAYYLDAVQTPKAGMSEYYGFNDDGTWAKRQPFLHPSKLDAGFTGNNFNNAAYVFLYGQVIDGMWIQNAVSGRGMTLTQKTHLKNCTINNNTGVGGGGGVQAISGSTLTNCVICNNTSAGAGGVYIDSASALINCVITNNNSSSHAGGVYVVGSSTLTNCIITNNTGSTGGGAYANSSSVLTGCVVTNNTGTVGGGIRLEGSASIRNCVVTNNTATSSGGGISAFTGTLYNCTTINNTAPGSSREVWAGNPAAIYNHVSWGGDIYIGLANYAYKIYNCASNFALTGVSGWSNLADVQNFLPLTEFPFVAPGVAPYDGSGAFFGSATIGRTEEALAFIDRVILGRMPNAHLPTGSPLIGAGYYGAGVTPDTDADGKVRPNPPSIGAYEP